MFVKKLWPQKFKKSETAARYHDGIIVEKWKNVRDVLYMSSQYENVMNLVVNKWGREKMKPLHIIEYDNGALGYIAWGSATHTSEKMDIPENVSLKKYVKLYFCDSKISDMVSYLTGVWIVLKYIKFYTIIHNSYMGQIKSFIDFDHIWYMQLYMNIYCPYILVYIWNDYISHKGQNWYMIL